MQANIRLLHYVKFNMLAVKCPACAIYNRLKANNDHLQPNNRCLQANNYDLHPNNDRLHPNNRQVHRNNYRLHANNSCLQANNKALHPNNNRLQHDKREIRANNNRHHRIRLYNSTRYSHESGPVAREFQTTFIMPYFPLSFNPESRISSIN